MSVTVELQKLFAADSGSIPLRADFDLSETELSGEYPFKRPFSFVGQVINRAGAVTLEGEVSGDYEIACDRCGAMFTERVKVPIDFVVVETAPEEERDDYLVAENGKLELDPVVRTEVLLALPTKHLCKVDCRGLCSNCGADLNKGECSCSKKADNPFADALSAFFD